MNGNPFSGGSLSQLSHYFRVPKELWPEVKQSNSVCFALDTLQTGSREWNLGT